MKKPNPEILKDIHLHERGIRILKLSAGNSAIQFYTDHGFKWDIIIKTKDLIDVLKKLEPKKVKHANRSKNYKTK